VDRATFLKAAAILAASAAAGAAALVSAKRTRISNEPRGADSVRPLPKLSTIPVDRNSDPLLRMQRELARAMSKPVEQRHWMMVIDTRKCVGCHACTIACIAENKFPPGVVYRPVVTEEMGRFPHVGHPIHAPALHAVQRTPLHARLPGQGHLETAGWHRCGGL
jgi:molybdopterin-containing oxidoreductase family iron-sulfur binding subunit